jgi:sec-independent protein translocase protein TatA
VVIDHNCLISVGEMGERGAGAAYDRGADRDPKVGPMPEFLRGWEILILLVLLVLLFGAKRLPDTARGLGRSLRIFKAETKGLRDDDQPAATTPPTTAAPAAPREITDGGSAPTSPAPTPEREHHDS